MKTEIDVIGGGRGLFIVFGRRARGGVVALVEKKVVHICGGVLVRVRVL